MDRSNEELKNLVKEKYSAIALQEKEVNASSCCGATVSSGEVYNIMTDDYSDLEGYNPDADLGLGCGLPTELAMINAGDVVIDLGSGAGNDCFVARHETGDKGKVIGIDFSEPMIRRARINADKLGYNNVEFRTGDIEDMPVGDNTADVVISNCVLNLLPEKSRIMKEIFRVLKPGGHFSISDIVLDSDLPEALKKDAEMYAGCVSGAIMREEYLSHIEHAGFEQITIQKDKPIIIPDDILTKHLKSEDLREFKANSRITSISVFGIKPGTNESSFQNVLTENAIEKDPCCPPNSGCC